MKRITHHLLFTLVILVATVLLAEVLVRVLKPPPRRVLFRAHITHGFEDVDGTWIWHDAPDGPPPRSHVLEDRDCDVDGAFVVLVLGDSIFNGVNIKPPQVGSVLLKHRLQTTWPDTRFCVKNLAVPGYSLYQGIARAHRLLDTVMPDAVLMELWGGPPRVPARVGQTVYFFEGLARGEDGLANPYHVPIAMNAPLLQYSRLYEYLVLAAPDDCRPCRYDLTPHEPMLDRFVDRVTSGGAVLTPFMASFLNHPFTQQPEPLFLTMEGYEAWLARRGLQPVRLWEALAEHDSAALAMDDVHFNAEGQSLLADVWFDALRPTVEAWRTARASEAQRDGTPTP